ncbi:hypothetical protein [Legionella sp. W05-934-2]|uniref:hypothetical protein n=1 Tax=Legionella sp. W05-934-2 TaxID=1198649 RepID=UPI003462265D
MKKVLALLAMVFVGQQTLAGVIEKPALDKVYLTLSAKQWVKTETALLQVVVSATLNDADMVKTRGQIMTQLQTIAKGEWNITQFDRSQDSSGLEKLTVQAQARIEQTQLNQVYQRAKSVSKPGLAYLISQINFEPGLADIEKGKVSLRQKLYQQVTIEIDQLNKQFPDQHYSLNQLIFTEPGQVQPFPMAQRARENTMVLTALAKAPSIAVSNKITMQALVVLASNRSDSSDNNK